MSDKNVFHLGVSKSSLQGASIAILPGDPGRVDRIASLFENSKLLAQHREFVVMLAMSNNTPVVICSTGIGGPSTSIAVEELAQCGVKNFLRVGTTGTIQSHIKAGDLIVTTASVRLDGASQHFAPIEFPAVADFEITSAMREAALGVSSNVHTGITASSDTFYPGQERYDTFSGNVIKSFQGSLKQWQQMSVLNYEMESATLLTMCASMGLKAGCIAGVVINRTENEVPKTEVVVETEKTVMSAVVNAAKILIATSNN
jgi:uridine phosphorylase